MFIVFILLHKKETMQNNQGYILCLIKSDCYWNLFSYIYTWNLIKGLLQFVNNDTRDNIDKIINYNSSK